MFPKADPEIELLTGDVFSAERHGSRRNNFGQPRCARVDPSPYICDCSSRKSAYEGWLHATLITVRLNAAKVEGSLSSVVIAVVRHTGPWRNEARRFS